MSDLSYSPPSSPVLRKKRRAVPLRDMEVQGQSESPILFSEQARSPTEYVSPIVTIRRPPSTPSNYISSPLSAHDRVETDFILTSPTSKFKKTRRNIERSPTEYVSPIVTKIRPPFTPSTSGKLKRGKSKTMSDLSYSSPSSPLLRKKRRAVPLSDMEVQGQSESPILFSEQARSPTEYVSPIVTIRRPPSIPSNYMSSPLSVHDRVETDFILTSPTSEFKKTRRNITIDTSHIAKKIKLRISQEELLSDSANNISIISCDMNSSSSSISLSMLLSPMRSDDRELSEDDMLETNVESPSVGYVSSTTSLWDLPIKSDLNYSVGTASTSTGSEDYSIVFERRYQKDIQRRQQKRYEEEQRRIDEQQKRREAFEEFSIKGITWSVFDPEKIMFSIKPKDIYPDHFSSKRIYTFSMIFNGKWWAIKIFRVPEWQTILKIYEKSYITDRKIKQFLQYVVNVIFRNIELEKEVKDERYADYRSGKELDLNESDIELFLNEDEKKRYREKCEKLSNLK